VVAETFSPVLSLTSVTGDPDPGSVDTRRIARRVAPEPHLSPGGQKAVTPDSAAAAAGHEWYSGAMALAALLAALLVTDIASLGWAPAGKVGVVLWCLSWLALAAHAARCFGSMARDVVTRGRGLATVLVLLALTATVIVATFDTRLLHFETTQEIACTLNCFADSPTWGYTDTCLFGYPTRQFLVPALPSLLFGRSYTALTFGGALYFLIAISIFARGLLSHLEDRPEGDLLAALVLSFLPHIHYFNHFMYSFEESIYPLLFGMILCGLALQWMKAPSLAYPFLIGLVLLHGAWAYTPALALVVLGLVLLCAHALGSRTLPRTGRIASLGVSAVVVASFIVSLWVRSDLHAFGERSAAELVSDLGAAFRHIVIAPIDPGEVFVTRFLLVFLIGALVGSLTFVDGWRGVVLGAWMWGVLVASIVLPGSAYYNTSLQIHKAIVLFPVMFCVVVFLWRRLDPRPPVATWALVALLGVSCLVGGSAQYAYVWNRPPEWRIALIHFLERALPDGGRSRARMLLAEVADSSSRVQNLHDFMQYFLPKLETGFNEVTPSTCDEVTRRVHRAAIADREVLLFVPAGTSSSECFSGAGLEPLGTFQSGADEPLELTRLVFAPDSFARRGLDFRLPYAHPSVVRYGFEPPKIDVDWAGGPLRVGGVEYPTGIGMHAWCRMSYDVPAGAMSFVSVVGLADDVQSCPVADVVFQVLDQDERVLFDSGLVRPGDPPVRVHVGLAGTTRLTLAVTEGVNGRDCDHAVWGKPLIVLSEVAGPPR
jgi:hypothetical protein